MGQRKRVSGIRMTVNKKSTIPDYFTLGKVKIENTVLFSCSRKYESAARDMGDDILISTYFSSSIDKFNLPYLERHSSKFSS